MQPPSIQDVFAARPRVYSSLRPSPLLKHPLLDEALGLNLWVKHENHNPTCAFKVRGGLNLISQLPADEKRRGMISASTGNHGQSIAFAARIHGVGCCIVRSGLKSRAQVIGVQAAKADAFARSWRGPARVVGESADTFAEGMATRTTFDLTFGLLKDELDEVVTLDEDQLRDGVRMALGLTHNLAEGAGGAALAAAKMSRETPVGKKMGG